MSKDLLRDQWASLGVAFNTSSKVISDPETAILTFLKSGEFPDDRKMINLILAWLKEYSSIVHIERLKSMIDELGSFELAILGGIAKKCITYGDFRWRTIVSFVNKRNTGKITFDTNESEYLLNKKGIDEDFLNFGLQVFTCEPGREEKIIQLSQMIRQNMWIKHRILFGVNMRADIATVMVLNLATNAYQASKYLHCSFNSASRNWNDLTNVDFIKGAP